MSITLSDFSGFPLPLRRLVSNEVPAMAYVRRVADGDSLTVFFDRRFHDSSVKRLRLRAINAEELGTPKGDAAAAFLTKLLPPGTPVVVTTYKITYDRYEASVMFLKNKVVRDLAAYLVEKGHAVRAAPREVAEDE